MERRVPGSKGVLTGLQSVIPWAARTRRMYAGCRNVKVFAVLSRTTSQPSNPGYSGELLPTRECRTVAGEPRTPRSSPPPIRFQDVDVVQAVLRSERAIDGGGRHGSIPHTEERGQAITSGSRLCCLSEGRREAAARARHDAPCQVSRSDSRGLSTSRWGLGEPVYGG